MRDVNFRSDAFRHLIRHKIDGKRIAYVGSWKTHFPMPIPYLWTEFVDMDNWRTF